MLSLLNDDEGVEEGWQDQVENDDGAGFKNEQQKGRKDDGEAEACDSLGESREEDGNSGGEGGKADYWQGACLESTLQLLTGLG